MHRHTNWNKGFPSPHLPRPQAVLSGVCQLCLISFLKCWLRLSNWFHSTPGLQFTVGKLMPWKITSCATQVKQSAQEAKTNVSVPISVPGWTLLLNHQSERKKLFWHLVKWQGRLYWSLLSRAEKWYPTLSARGRGGIYRQGTEWGASVDGKSPWGAPKGGNSSNLT